MNKDPPEPTSVRPQDNQSRSATATSPRAEIDRFLDQVKALSPGAKTGRHGRLIFALDATMSRQPTWDQACKLQAEMFHEAAAAGGLDIKILVHARRETENNKVAVLVFVGDAMEEPLDELCVRAGELGLRNVKAFMFQEGHDPICEQAFREIARLTGGAYCRFAPGAAHELAELLRAAAAYAAGGLKALTDLKGYTVGVARLIEQLK
jgi:hypothetical protein